MKTKIYILLLVLGAFLFCNTISLYAQNEIRVGLKGGISAYKGNIEFSGFELNTEYNNGILAGLFVNFAIHHFVSLQPELLYVQKNTGDTNGLLNDSDTVESAFAYIDLPVMLQLKIPVNHAFSPFLTAGPYIGYLLEAEDTINGVTEDVSEFMKDVNFGLLFGAGVALGRFHLEARYDLGLSNTIDEDTIFNGSNGGADLLDDVSVNAKLRGFQFSAGISF
jgi:hypothetical protein